MTRVWKESPVLRQRRNHPQPSGTVVRMAFAVAAPFDRPGMTPEEKDVL